MIRILFFFFYTVALIEQTSGQSLSADSIRRRAEKSVAFISGSGGGCTAFVIGDGYLVTSGHCLDVLTTDTVTIQLNGQSAKAVLKGHAKFNLTTSTNASSFRDLSVLEIKYISKKIKYSALPIARYSLQKNDSIYSYSGQFRKLYSGTIADYDRYSIVTADMPICVGGNSGSPYLDEYGNVVGVLSFGAENETKTCVGANIILYLEHYVDVPGVRIVETSPNINASVTDVSLVTSVPPIGSAIIKATLASIVSFPKNNSIGCMLNNGCVLAKNSDFSTLSDKKSSQLFITSHSFKQNFIVRKIMISDSLDLCLIKIEGLVNTPSILIANSYESNSVEAFVVTSPKVDEVKQAMATTGLQYEGIALGVLDISINQLSFIFNKKGQLIGISIPAGEGETVTPFIDLISIRQKIINSTLATSNSFQNNK
ncbi:MAG: trypsin-like peptidase domain-containing protein [Chitinophagaceae bacterium]|nr:trypsin-like peptidase domain-containing protein [Chitinophagaceae bacterium]